MFETNFMPFVVTDSVIIDRNKLTIKCFVRTKHEGEEPFWFKEDVISSYVRIVFFVLHDSNPGSLPAITTSMLTSGNSRIKNILQQARQPTSIENWESIVTQNFPHKIINLKEVRDYSQNNTTINEMSMKRARCK